MKELDELLFGKNEPVIHEVIVAVTIYNRAFVVSITGINEEDFDGLYDGDELEDSLSDKQNLPKEPGLYKCQIRYHTFKCHHPLDPVEWDSSITIESCIKLTAPPLVKPLNWKTRKGGAFGVGGIFYRVYRSGIRECLEIVGSKVPIMCYHTLDEARSAAYAHHAALVLSQLEI